jgi:hypothetical protein
MTPRKVIEDNKIDKSFSATRNSNGSEAKIAQYARPNYAHVLYHTAEVSWLHISTI